MNTEDKLKTVQLWQPDDARWRELTRFLLANHRGEDLAMIASRGHPEVLALELDPSHPVCRHGLRFIIRACMGVGEPSEVLKFAGHGLAARTDQGYDRGALMAALAAVGREDLALAEAGERPKEAERWQQVMRILSDVPADPDLREARGYHSLVPRKRWRNARHGHYSFDRLASHVVDLGRDASPKRVFGALNQFRRVLEPMSWIRPDFSLPESDPRVLLEAAEILSAHLDAADAAPASWGKVHALGPQEYAALATRQLRLAACNAFGAWFDEEGVRNAGDTLGESKEAVRYRIEALIWLGDYLGASAMIEELPETTDPWEQAWYHLTQATIAFLNGEIPRAFERTGDALPAVTRGIARDVSDEKRMNTPYRVDYWGMPPFWGRLMVLRAASAAMLGRFDVADELEAFLPRDPNDESPSAPHVVAAKALRVAAMTELDKQVARRGTRYGMGGPWGMVLDGFRTSHTPIPETFGGVQPYETRARAAEIQKDQPAALKWRRRADRMRATFPDWRARIFLRLL